MAWKKKHKRLVIGLVLLAMPATAWLTHTSVRGVEWSPDTFRHRSYRYRTIFSGIIGDGIPVASHKMREWETDLERWLKRQGYVEERGANPRWYLQHEMSSSPLHFGYGKGAANYLCGQVRCSHGESTDWIEWSQSYPQIAADFWPQYVKLVRNGKHGIMSAENCLWLIRYTGDKITDEKYRQILQSEIQRAFEEAREPQSK